MISPAFLTFNYQLNTHVTVMLTKIKSSVIAADVLVKQGNLNTSCLNKKANYVPKKS